MIGESGRHRFTKLAMIVPLAGVLALSSCGFLGMDGDDVDETPVAPTVSTPAATTGTATPATGAATPAAKATGTATPAAGTATPAAGTATPAAAMEGEGEVRIAVLEDQESDGTTVTIATVAVEEDGWIAIHRDENGAPGEVIGHAAVNVGENMDVQVTLDTPLTEAETTLWAMLHTDAGTVGTYEFPGPDGPVMVEGEVAMQEFSVILEE